MYFVIGILQFLGWNLISAIYHNSTPTEYHMYQQNNIMKYKIIIFFLNLSLLIFVTFSLIVSTLQLVFFNDFGNYALSFGGFDKTLGIEHSANIFKALCKFLIALVGFCYVINQIVLFESGKRFFLFRHNRDDFIANGLFLSCSGAFFGLINTNDIFNMYVFIEVSSICLYSSVFLNKTRDSIIAGFDYLIIGTFASCMIVFVIIILYYLTGQLNIDLIISTIKNDSNILNNQNNQFLLSASFVIFVLACFIKMGLPPFYKWAINFYTKSDLLLSSFTAPVATKMFLYVLFCIVFKIYGSIDYFLVEEFKIFLINIFAFLILLLSFLCFTDNNILRIIVFSSISNICYSILAVLITQKNLSSSIVMVVGDVIIKSFIFGSLALIVKKYYNIKIINLINNKTNKDFLKLIANCDINLRTIFVICFATIASIPPTPMFFAKIDAMLQILNLNFYVIFIFLILANLFSVLYFVKIVLFMIFFNNNDLNIRKILATKLNIITFWHLNKDFQLKNIDCSNVHFKDSTINFVHNKSIKNKFFNEYFLFSTMFIICFGIYCLLSINLFKYGF